MELIKRARRSGRSAAVNWYPTGHNVRSARSTAVLLVLLAASMTSCGAESCLPVRYDSAVRVSATDPVSIVEFCVGDQCLSTHPSSVWPENGISVGDKASTYPYRIEILDPVEGARTIEGTVATKEYWVSGRHCGPSTANATLNISSTGEITTSYP